MIADRDPHRPGVPEAARRYVEHAIAPGTPPARSVRLRMHGEIKLRTWRTFGAEEELVWDREMIWRARTTMNGLPISGYDRVGRGVGEQNWKILGLIPVLRTSGPDIARSGAGRMAGESIWLPSVLAEASWSTPHPPSHRRESPGDRIEASLRVFEEKPRLTLAVAQDGRLVSVAYPRWGNPGGIFGYETFGGVAEAESTFGRFTIPSRLRLGWYFGTERFEREGEFIRITIDEARYT